MLRLRLFRIFLGMLGREPMPKEYLVTWTGEVGWSSPTNTQHWKERAESTCTEGRGSAVTAKATQRENATYVINCALS